MPNWKKVITSGSYAHLIAVTASSQITVNPVAATTEAGVVIGPPPAGGSGEGGQLALQPASGFTSGSFIDQYQTGTTPYFRVLRGTAASSDALLMQINNHTKQLSLPAYTGASSFTGTATANLAVDSNGNVITVSTSGGSVFPYTGIAAINGGLIVTGSVTASGAIHAQANGAMYFRGGDDAEFWDINVANTVGIYGQQNADRAGLKLGSSGPTLFGSASKFGIGTTTPTNGTLEVNGNVWANSFTGSLFGTASYATQALSASYAPSTPAFPYTGSAEITGSLGVTGSLSTQTFDGTNYVTAIEVTDFKRNINDVMGTSSIDADGRTLSDSAANLSVNWEQRTLLNPSGVTYVDWQNRYLYGPGPIPTSTAVAVNWSSRQLTDNNGNVILDWQTATFTGTASFATSASWAPGGNPFPFIGDAQISGSLGVTGSFSVLDSIDSANKILIGSGPIPGSTENSVNWDSRTLFDSDGNFSVRWGLLRSMYDANASQSVDWNNRLLKFDNGPGDYTVNWNAGLLRDTGSNNSINWQDRITIDTGTKTSIDWQNRQLKDSSGNENLNWSSGVSITGSATISGSLTVTGSLLITGSSTLINEGPTILSGSFKVQGAGDGFGGPITTAITVDDINFTRKLHDSQTGSGSLDFANRDLLDATGAGAFNWSGFASTIDSRLYINQTINSTSRDALITNIGTGGHLLNDVTFDSTVQVNDLCYLDTTNVWFPVDQSTNSASRLLGICMGYDPMTYIGQVLLEGDVVVTTGTGYPIVQGANYGLAVFIAQGSGTIMDTAEPASGIIRRLGYCYHNGGGSEWIMKFRPSNDWA